MSNVAIRRILEGLTIDTERSNYALAKLETAITEFKFLSTPEVSQTRNELNDLNRALVKSAQILESLSPNSINLLCDAIGGPKGAMTEIINNLIQTVDNSIIQANRIPNRKPNIRLTILAYNVAVIMRDDLGIKPTRTRDDENIITGVRGGAAYASILRAVIKCADEVPADDLFPLITKALDLMDDPHGELFIEPQL